MVQHLILDNMWNKHRPSATNNCSNQLTNSQWWIQDKIKDKSNFCNCSFGWVLNINIVFRWGDSSNEHCLSKYSYWEFISSWMVNHSCWVQNPTRVIYNLVWVHTIKSSWLNVMWIYGYNISFQMPMSFNIMFFTEL